MIKVTYSGHSGFLAELEDISFLFDFYRGSLPKRDAKKKMIVFVSHAHYDHYNKEIFKLRDESEDIRFILSSDIPVDRWTDKPDVVFMAPNEEKTVFGCTVRTLRSNDQGVAYLVRYGKETIYHAGDLNWWHWQEESETFNKMIRRTYQSEINKLQGEKIGLAFVPVDPRLGEQYCWGLDCFMRRTDTKRVFPMHFWENYEIFDRLMLEKCTEEYKDRIMRIQNEGQVFLLDS
ncbi:MAG TPA: MBL fold metallo-hydrolase [Candidatus Mediterraneibacter pullistercoris]|nr:MBL fold metallo-hydrolase [Candidatus Mediterraneibacter pullistercoris]